jgi:hypothetical protein
LDAAAAVPKAVARFSLKEPRHLTEVLTEWGALYRQSPFPRLVLHATVPYISPTLLPGESPADRVTQAIQKVLQEADQARQALASPPLATITIWGTTQVIEPTTEILEAGNYALFPSEA